MKKNKIGKKILKIVLVIILSLVMGVIAYKGSFYLDKIFKYYGKAEIKVTFDDTKSYVIPNVSNSNKEEALETWPYMFTIENEGNRKGLYQIIIKDMETSTIARTNLQYVLMMDDKEVATGNLDAITNDILYTGDINKDSSQRYKLYIWVTDHETNDEKEDVYEYQLSLNAIKEGGPGF